MATKVIMPKLSPTMEEGQLSRWLKKEGDKVSMGEPLAEIDTDKATMEMQALGNGVLRKILINEGESAPLGQLIAVIGEPDEDISSLISEAATPQPAKTPAAATPESAEPEAAPATVPETETIADAKISGNGGAAPKPTEVASTGRLIVSPLAARMAAEAGLDLRSVSGTGPCGRIIKRDVESLISEGKSDAAASP
jgi:pyruvate dehydrogenase E2 component (dihydrolipoamide acetyltransferase)